MKTITRLSGRTGNYTLKDEKKMTIKDVKNYFANVSRAVATIDGIKNKFIARVSGTYCERCSIGIGEGYKYKEGDVFVINGRGFYLCPSCFKDKENGVECTPDLEDLI